MNLKNAIKLLGEYTAGRFDVYLLSGSGNAARRAGVLALALGVDNVPKRLAGVTALRSQLYQMANISGTCRADMDANFAVFCVNLLANG